MASKYASIIDKLPKSLGTDPDYQEKVNALKRKILEPEPDGSTPEERQELTTEAVELFTMEITAMMQVLNDNMIRSLGGNLHAVRLAWIMDSLRTVKEMYEKQEKVTNLLIDAYGQILVDQYEVEGTTSLKLDSGASIRIQCEPHANVVDKDANRQWAIENGLERSLALPWQTVNALTKEALLRGDPEPDGVEAVAITKIVRTRAK